MSIGLADYQWQYRGVTFGAGLDLRLHQAEGIEDIAIDSGNVAVPRGDGDIPGLHRIRAKSIILDLGAVGASRSQDLADTLTEAYAAFQRTEEPEPLYFKLPGFDERFIYVRVIDRSVKHKADASFGYRPLKVKLHAADPRIYGSDERTQQLSIYDATGGGSDFDWDFDEGPGGDGIEFTVDTSSEVIVTNAGDAPAYPLLGFYGPASGTVTGVEVTNLTTGQTCEIATTIATDKVLHADMRRIITADPGDDPYIHIDGSSRYGDWTLPRTPFYLAPGDNSLRYEITGTATSAPLRINYRDTWI